jgi:membrane-associated phospholipid phosphatase
VAYHLSSALFVPPHEGAEALFARFDRWVRDLVDLPRMMARAPRLVAEFLELSYFGYYAALPLGYLALVLTGHGGQADRYWTLVLLAQFPCFVLLPWVRTRPPWALEAPGPMDERPLLVRRLNRFVLSHASIHFNTFPSSHTAGTLATCLGVMALAPATGLALFILSVCVALATIVGRYHYAGDAIAAVATALAAWAVVIYGF